MKMKDAIDDFINYCTFEKGLTENTITAYHTDLEIFFKYFEDNGLSVENINTSDIENYLKYEINSGKKDSTIAHKLTTIKSFFSYLSKTNIITHDVAVAIRRPKLRRLIPKTLNVEDIDCLLDINLITAFDYRNKAMLELLYGTGLRISELINLKVFDFDYSACIIRVMGKGRKERIIPLGEYSIYYVKLYLEHRKDLLQGKTTDYMFLNNHGEGISRQGFFKILKKILLDKGLNPNVSPHTLRHSFATHLLNRGADLRSIQEFLGHSDVSTTKIYTHVADDKVRKDYQQYHPRNHKEKENKL